MTPGDAQTVDISDVPCSLFFDQRARNRFPTPNLENQIWRTKRVQVKVASLRLFLRTSTGPNRAVEPRSLGRVRDPVRIAEGPTHDFGFSILDCGLKQHESHCRKRLLGERGSSSIAFMRGSGRGHPLSGTCVTWMAPNVHWLRQCRRAGLYEQGKATYEKRGLNLANLSDEHIEAEDDYQICVRRGRDEETKPKKRQRKMKPDDEHEEES